MSGENDYVDNRIKNIETQIEDIERSVGLKDIVYNVEAERLLGLSETDLDKMTAEECVNAKYILLQHALVIQKKLNRAITIKNWCERAITVILSKEYNNIDNFMTYEVKRESVVLGNGYASRLKDISVEQQQIIDVLSHLSMSISSIANSFQTLYMSKRKVENEGY